MIALGENPIEIGLTVAQLKALPAFVVMNILANDATRAATAVLPSFGFAEKRGSMINGKGRLQRLNRAVRGPGQARDDWEILRDLIQAVSGQNGIYIDRRCLPANERIGPAIRRIEPEQDQRSRRAGPGAWKPIRR